MFSNDLSSCASKYLEGTVYQPCAEEFEVRKIATAIL
jgi:hypothetical protein